MGAAARWYLNFHGPGLMTLAIIIVQLCNTTTEKIRSKMDFKVQEHILLVLPNEDH